VQCRVASGGNSKLSLALTFEHAAEQTSPFSWTFFGIREHLHNMFRIEMNHCYQGDMLQSVLDLPEGKLVPACTDLHPCANWIRQDRNQGEHGLLKSVLQGDDETKINRA
jgi:hypothetical protein